MEIFQYIHRLNMTEAGMSGTKALFLRVPTDAHQNVKDLWGIKQMVEDKNYSIQFTDSNNKKKYTFVLRKFSSNSKELRINSIVQFLIDNKVETGDEITFSKIVKEDGLPHFHVAAKKNKCVHLCYVKAKRLFVILNNDLLPLDSRENGMLVSYNGRERTLKYKFVEINTLRDAAVKIEGDSTAKGLSFDLYELSLDGKIPKTNLSLYHIGEKYILLEEKKWEYHHTCNK